MMTFHESYGHLPMRLLRLYKKVNVSPADHDDILAAFNYTWQDAENITPEVWEKITEFVNLSVDNNQYRPSRYM